ncbi:HNH endonuclease [Streptomyces phage Mildred21]|uniref:HNH endonuclease n=1 Tax=Streptomyces phage Mildred21 TaxID=2023959 RepID=A0A222YU62_9CAUD|nr:HNH endonuclease [Streptomyces phage Mildred21]ASR75515.1 HNH endonuclease [Streptomyces phage Mildred21]
MSLTGEAKREYQRKWVADRRAAGIEYLGGSCRICGATENLNVDHKDASTKVDHRIWSWAWDRALKELDKCQLLCEKHHREKTKANGETNLGEKNGQAKLTVNIVKQIREEFAKGDITKAALARKYRVDEKAIRDLLAGRTWK